MKSTQSALRLLVIFFVKRTETIQVSPEADRNCKLEEHEFLTCIMCAAVWILTHCHRSLARNGKDH